MIRRKPVCSSLTDVWAPATCQGLFAWPERRSRSMTTTLTRLHRSGVDSRGCGREWVILTKDKQVQRRKPEQLAIEEARAAAFVLTAGDITGRQMGELFVKALPRMQRLLAKYSRPLIATISRSGAVTVKRGRRRGSVRR